MHKAYHSGESEADNSQTPQWLIRQLQDVTGVDISHDVCARKNSAKADSYWTKDDDALKLNWLEKYYDLNANYEMVNSFWMNPPFSKAKEFTTKAADEALSGVVTLGCCVHAPDRSWFQEMEKRATFVYVPNHRIQFLKHDGKPFTRIDKHGKEVKSGANFPICFPLWTPFNNGGEAKFIRFECDKEKYS